MEKGKVKVEAPSWNLSDLYKGPEDPQITKDLESLKEGARIFAQNYEGKVVALSVSAFVQSIERYEEISEQLGRLSSFASLLFAEDMNNKKNAAFYQNTQEKTVEISSHLIFYTLEVNQIPQEDLNKKFEASQELSRYRPWVDHVRLFKGHQLSKDLEHVFHELSLPASRNWVRLYDETFASMTFALGGESLSSAEILNVLTTGNAAERKKAAEVFGGKLQEHSSLLALILNTLAKEKQIEDKWRGYGTPITPRNMANCVEDDVVDALIVSVREQYANLSHRYYRLKAGWMGQDTLNYWDRNAPLPEDTQRFFPWEEARAIVLSSYQSFSKEMADIGRLFFDRDWIDATLRPGKDSGAFSHPTVPSAHPYILQNYQGKIWDVMTLAHELGHGIHQMLAREQGYLMAETPLTLAETASIFGEMLTFQSLLELSKTREEKKILLAGKVSDMLNSIVRQISFSQFEKEFYNLRQSKELSVEEINHLWLDTQRESLGPSVRLTKDYGYYWSYISHFFHVPFYVYAYAFGNCLVNALFSTYQKGLPHFQTKYVEMLKAGGTRHHRGLLAPFELDIARPDFWHKGLDLVSQLIDELEDLS